MAREIRGYDIPGFRPLRGLNPGYCLRCLLRVVGSARSGLSGQG